MFHSAKIVGRAIPFRSIVRRQRGGFVGISVSAFAVAHRAYGASSSATERASTLMAEGNDMIEQGRADRAIECYVDAMAEVGETADLMYSLGNAYCQAGRVTDAMVAFRKSLEHDPQQPDTLVNLANLYSSVGDQKEAIVLYQRAIGLRPDDAEARHNLGLSFSKIGDWGAAVRELKASRDIDPNMPMEPLKYALIRMVGGK